MGAEASRLAAVVEAGPDYDDEELFQLTQGLRGELLELEVDAVDLGAEGEAPDGAKGVELLAIGGLVVKFALNSSLLKSVVDTTTAWLGRQGARSVKLNLDGDTLELTGVSSEEQSKLVEQWIARHANDG
jgi:hypothetical protein